MSFSSGTGGGLLGGFQLICTAGRLSLITCTQERPFSIASNESPYLLISQSVNVGGTKWLRGGCVDRSSATDDVSKLMPSAHSVTLVSLPQIFIINA